MQIAKRQGVVNPENTFFSVKRFIGRKMAEVGSESQQVPYRLADSAGAVKIKSTNAGKDFSPEEISAQVLRKLVDDAAKFLNDKVCVQQEVLAGFTQALPAWPLLFWCLLRISNNSTWQICMPCHRHCTCLAALQQAAAMLEACYAQGVLMLHCSGLS